MKDFCRALCDVLFYGPLYAFYVAVAFVYDNPFGFVFLGAAAGFVAGLLIGAGV